MGAWNRPPRIEILRRDLARPATRHHGNCPHCNKRVPLQPKGGTIVGHAFKGASCSGAGRLPVNVCLDPNPRNTH